MPPVVRVKKTQLNYFREQARSTPKEIQALLVGVVVSPDLIVIHRLVYPKKYAEQTTNCVAWFASEYDEVAAEAAKKNLRIVGTIHSHPDWIPILSPQDHKGHITEGYRISGICGVENNKTRVVFWVAESSLSAKIQYV